VKTYWLLRRSEQGVPEHARAYGLQVRLDAMELHRPRQWGACWLSCHLYEQLELDRFWAARLPDSREGTSWQHILQTLVCYRLIDPGSEWRLHRQWFEQSATGDLLGEDYSLVSKNALYRCLRDLRHLTTGPIPRTANAWEGLVYSRLSALPEKAEPLQRAQLVAALSVGTEIIRLRRIAHRFDQDVELDGALDAVAKGDSSAAAERLARLDQRLAALPNTRPGARARLRARSSILAMSEALAQHAAYFDSGVGR
jgi:hypothetical protein